MEWAGGLASPTRDQLTEAELMFKEYLRSAWRNFMRTIRRPLLRLLSAGDLIVIGDVYASNSSPAPLIQVPANGSCDVIGAIAAHDGPPGIVPRGGKPPKPPATIKAVKPGNWGDPGVWERI
jgi:hypothetical protein